MATLQQLICQRMHQRWAGTLEDDLMLQTDALEPSVPGFSGLHCLLRNFTFDISCQALSQSGTAIREQKEKCLSPPSLRWCHPAAWGMQYNVICTGLFCMFSGLQQTFQACFSRKPIQTEKTWGQCLTVTIDYFLGTSSYKMKAIISRFSFREPVNPDSLVAAFIPWWFWCSP